MPDPCTLYRLISHPPALGALVRTGRSSSRNGGGSQEARMLKRMQEVTGSLYTLYSPALRHLGKQILAVTQAHTSTHRQHTSRHRHACRPPHRLHRARHTSLQIDTHKQEYGGQDSGFWSQGHIYTKITQKCHCVRNSYITDYITAYFWVPWTQIVGYFVLTHRYLAFGILAHVTCPYKCHVV